MDGDTKEVYRCITAAAKNYHFPTVYEIAELIDMPVERVTVALTMLEREGYIFGEERTYQ